MKRLTNLTAMFFGIIFILASCSKEDPVPLPTVNFIADVTNYDVMFTVEATDAASYSWDYGNGETSTQAGSHSYTYEESGDYTVKVTVTNESGSASKTLTVNIAASMTEQLAGTEAAGKTWILDRGASTNLQKIEPELTLWAGLPGDALFAFSLEEEYDNTYTFKPDGGYEIDGVNGAVLTGLVYTLLNGLEIVVPPIDNSAGLAGAAFQNLTDATYTLHEGKDLTFTIANEDYPAGTNSDGITEVTFPNANYITFSEGAFLGIRDYFTTVMIRNITKDKMDVTIFLSSIDPSVLPETLGLPSLAISTSLKVK